jgi:hypothetical protein
MALPVPAQLTRMRSWPWAARALAKAGVDLFLGGDVALAEDAADFLCDFFALGFVHVEDGALHALGRQVADRGFAEAGGAAGDNRGDRGIEFHGRVAPGSG